jgi:hypothetical protein
MEEDRAGRERQKAELKAAKAAMQEQLDRFSATHKEELQAFFKEVELEEQVGVMQQEKHKLQTRTQENERARIRIIQQLKVDQDLVAKLQAQLAANEEAVALALHKDEEALLQLEDDIDAKMAAVQCEPLASLAIAEATKRGVDCDKVLFLVQKGLMDAELDRLMVPFDSQ